jgi:hypothetical protein
MKFLLGRHIRTSANLVARPSIQLSFAAPNNPTRTLAEPKMRIELTTYALRVRCSTPELPGRVPISLPPMV